MGRKVSGHFKIMAEPVGRDNTVHEIFPRDTSNLWFASGLYD
jgi:hypothetical protein